MPWATRSQRSSRSRRLLLLAVIVEGLLVTVALVWIQLRGLSVELGALLPGLITGLAAAGLLAWANYLLLRVAPPVEPVEAIRRLYQEMLQPLFAKATPVEIIGISVAAAIGEELLFRGVLQRELGIVVASVLFGIAHIGGRTSVVFGVWVMVMGGALGVLVPLTGGVLASVVAHGVYDVLAISYMRWVKPRRVRNGETLEAVNGPYAAFPAVAVNSDVSGDEDES